MQIKKIQTQNFSGSFRPNGVLWSVVGSFLAADKNKNIVRAFDKFTNSLPKTTEIQIAKITRATHNRVANADYLVEGFVSSNAIKIPFSAPMMSKEYTSKNIITKILKPIYGKIFSIDANSYFNSKTNLKNLFAAIKEASNILEVNKQKQLIKTDIIFNEITK